MMTHEPPGPTNSLPLHFKAQLFSQVASHSQWSYYALAIYPCFFYISISSSLIYVLWPPDAKTRLIRKDFDDGKDWRQEEKGTTEDGMAGWHHQLNGHEFEKSSGRWWKTGRAAIHGVAKSRTRLSDWTELNWCAVVHGVTKSWIWLSDWTTARTAKCIHCAHLKIMLFWSLFS